MTQPVTTNPYRLALLITAALSLNACTSLINAVTSEPIQPDPSETSIGTDIDDWQMGTMIGVNIKKASQQLADSHINVSTYNKVVLLTGEVASSELRTLAGNTARNYKDVRQVYNELKLQGSSSLLARTNDSWLTTKVKSKLLANKEIVSGEIEVVTESGIVYLMGIVSRDTADRATAVASHTGGVVKVVRVFEYIN
ncbi:MAG: BON domain-containing protein [Candidatus Reddybacter sp.]